MMKRVRKTACLILALLLAAFAVAGCSGGFKGGVVNDANGNVILLGEYNQSSEKWLACAVTYSGEIPGLTFCGSKITVTSKGANYGQVTVNENCTDNNLTLDANSQVGILHVQSGGTIKVNNTVGTVKNALIESGGVAWFDRMPEMLVIQPGGQAYVGGVLYDNTGGTADMVLPKAPVYTGTSDSGNNYQPAPSAPAIAGPDIVYVQEDSTAAQNYTISGNPAPTTDMSQDPSDNTAGATISGGLLYIPKLSFEAPFTDEYYSVYTAYFTAENTEGTATKEVKVYVYGALETGETTPEFLASSPGPMNTNVAGHVSGGSGTYTYSLASNSPALPAGLTLDKDTGEISGTTNISRYDQVIIIVVSDKVTPATARIYLHIKIGP